MTLSNNPGSNRNGADVKTQAAEPDFDPVADNIEAIANLYAHAEHQVDRHQRTIEAITVWLGRPQVLYGVIGFTLLWIIVNLAAPHLNIRAFDGPPFNWLQAIQSFGAIVLTIVILITQNRHSKAAERRSQLELQVNMLSEQKVTKIIQLLEELRRDIPSVQNRVDLEAENMQKSVDHHAVLTALDYRLEEMAVEEE
jgi:uncharacterized membrane protein